MIIFKQIRYFNFLATGAAGNSITLNQAPTTLLTAPNGCGKSTIIDAIIFALFGKSHRDINKNQLINSINGKNCLVELDCDIDGESYQIRRGIKPAIFEIFRDSILIDQEAATRDYQKFLEQQILKTNIKAFTQSVILGSASFTPFMQMKTSERREVIEDFLDIKIFGIMHSILKEEIYETKSDLSKLENKFIVEKTRIEGQKTLIAKLTEVNSQNETAIRTKIESLEQSIAKQKNQIGKNQIAIDVLNNHGIDIDTVSANIALLSKKINARNHHVALHSKTIDFLNSTEECPSCKQEIEEHHKKPVISKITLECESIKSDIDVITAELVICEDLRDKFMEQADKVRELEEDSRAIHKQITTTNRSIQILEDEITGLAVTDILAEKMKLKDMASDIISIIDMKTSTTDKRALQDKAYDILKDSGVKTTIIREYLPIINQMINRYLGVMEFFVDFSLDESFSEVVRSRCRDEFSYESFSTGEKKRIDVAILFAWRQVARMKNSINCNILFLDEILESGLDSEGLDSVFKIIEEESKLSNVFVISHNDYFKENFDKIITIKKVGDFSVID